MTEQIKLEEREKQISEIKARLKKYSFETPESEIDGEVLKTLTEQLMELEGNLGEEADARAAYKRFLEYRDRRDAEDAKLAAIMEGKRKKTIQRRKMAVAAAVAFVVLLTFGGTMGAYAHKNKGAFHWLEKDKEGLTMITSPDKLPTGTENGKASYYYSKEEVPEEYRDSVIEVGDLEALEGFELERIEIMEIGNFSKVMSSFVKEELGYELKIGCVDYGDMIFYNREKYIEYSYQDNGELEEEELEVLYNEEEGCTVYFLNDNKQYYVAGKFEVELLEKIAKEYKEYIVNFHKNLKM